MARDWAFTYAGLLVGSGGDSAYTVVGPYSFSLDDRTHRGSLRFSVVVQHATEATYVTKEAALAEAWNTPHGDLVVTLGATTRHSYKRSDGTGFNHHATAVMVGDRELDSRRSSRWECSVEWDLPADLYDTDGRRGARVLLESDASEVRTVTLSGEWTRTSTTAARAQFDAQVATWAATETTAIDSDATWELLPDRSETDTKDNVLVFSRAYREVLDGSGSDVANLRGENLAIEVSEEGPGDSVPSGTSVGRFVTVTLTYSAAVPRSAGTGADYLRTVWLGQVRPYLLQRAATAAGSGVVAVLDQRPTLEPESNRIAATMRCLVDPGNAFLTLRISVQDDISNGLILEPVWDGSPWSRDIHQGPGTWIRTVSIVALIPAGSSGGGDLVSIQQAGFKLVRTIKAGEGSSVGIPGDRFNMTATSEVRIYERAEEDQSGSRNRIGGLDNFGGGGGGGGGGPGSSNDGVIDPGSSVPGFGPTTFGPSLSSDGVF